jgi:hypothetical protein
MSFENKIDNGCIIATPFHCGMILDLIGYFLVLLMGIGVVLIFASQIRRLFKPYNIHAFGRANDVALLLGWIGFGVGFLLFSYRLCDTCERCGYMLQKGVEIDTVLMVLLTSIREDICPLVLGVSVIILSYIQRAVVIWKMCDSGNTTCHWTDEARGGSGIGAVSGQTDKGKRIE